MRIIGGKDYYDHGLAYGVDDSVVFVRTGRGVPATGALGYMSTWGARPNIELVPKAEQARGGLVTPSWNKNWRYNGTHYYADAVRALFCGHYYGGLRVRSYAPPSWHARSGYDPVQQPSEYTAKDWVSETFWDQNTAGRYLGKCGAHVRTGLLPGQSWAARNDPRSKPFYREKLEGELLEQLLTQRIATAVLLPEQTQKVRRPGRPHPEDQDYWLANADNLKDVDFIKLVDPVTAFQELSMWVGGVLPRDGNPMVQITDDSVKLAKHGMDKWSFRRMPEKVK